MAPHSADTLGLLLDPARLAQLCMAAGWPATVRESGLATVELDAGHARYHARLEAAGVGGLRAIVDLCDVSDCSAASRSAIEALLLATSVAVRQVRQVRQASVTPDEAEWAGLTTMCADAVAPEALDRALSALTVACRLAGREAQALRHEAIALEYLAWRAPAPPDAPAEVAIYNHRTMKENTCLQQP
jgi:hypothetical protein